MLSESLSLSLSHVCVCVCMCASAHACVHMLSYDQGLMLLLTCFYL